MRVRMEPGWERRIDDAAHDYLTHIAQEVLTDMRDGCPVETGALLSDLDYEVQGLTARVGAESTEYVLDVEFGTEPHVIEATDAEDGGALSWPGAAHPVRRVEHPGTAAQPFMRDALYKRRS